MSDPIRYTGKSDIQALGSPHWEHPEGEWVKWEDYARLKAEVERLQSFCTRTIIPNETLQAEVERLRKAGDAMYESKIGYYGEQIIEDMKHHSGELCRNWNAAKEGKPSV